ncbi:MAG TPA: serine hydrolase domain-containing protein [Candidatus Limnocylindrales bacterium]|nr:serine hydrolase domain-containing protein [Candidatus Limnocylindrales bacterium]
MRLFGLLCAMAAMAATPAFDGLYTGVTDSGSPGFAVMVRQGGRTIFAHGYGLRDLRTRTPIDARTNFRLASFTKQFTAMGIMLLARDGKLRYDETLGNVFPDFPAYGRGITIRQLMNHTGGLPDYEDLMGDRWTPEHQISDAEAMQLLKAQSKPKSPAGSKWEYSNSGYVVLGLVIQKRSGETYPAFLQKRIFGPLGMSHTLAYVKGANTVPERAYGHSMEHGKLVETDQSSTSATLGDGGVYSNLDDLAKWDDALQKHTLLSETEMKPALTPVSGYGFGWYLDPYRGHERMWHTGETMGFRTAIERFPKDGVSVVVLCNRADLDAASLALRAADQLLKGR